MRSLEDVMQELEERGSEQTRNTMIRHGAPEDTFGVKIADLKKIAKQIKGNQTLACELYETGNYDAMYLAGLLADGSQMTQKQLESWAKGASCGMISEYTVAWVATENPHARKLALKWIRSKSESLASSGWCTYAGIVATTPDEGLDLDEVQQLLERAVSEIESAPDRVRYTMNGFLIAVGSYVKPLLAQAKREASKVGTVSVDMGDTACTVPFASASIEKIEAAGRVGRKRKTIRC